MHDEIFYWSPDKAGDLILKMSRRNKNG